LLVAVAQADLFLVAVAQADLEQLVHLVFLEILLTHLQLVPVAQLLQLVMIQYFHQLLLLLAVKVVIMKELLVLVTLLGQAVQAVVLVEHQERLLSHILEDQEQQVKEEMVDQHPKQLYLAQQVAEVLLMLEQDLQMEMEEPVVTAQLHHILVHQ
jgi:hypothetical protein